MRNSYWWRPLACLLLSMIPRGFCQSVAKRIDLDEDTVRRWCNGMAALPASALRAICAELPEPDGRRFCYAVLPSRYQLFDQVAAPVSERDGEELMQLLDDLATPFEREARAVMRGAGDPERLDVLARDLAGFVLGWAQTAKESTERNRKVA